MSGPELLDKLATLPLLHQPGAVWDYGFGLDVLGLSSSSSREQSLGRYLRRQSVQAARHGRHPFP